MAFTDRGEGIFVLRFDDLDLTDDIVTPGGNGSSSAAHVPADNSTANDRQEATADAREGIRRILENVA